MVDVRFEDQGIVERRPAARLALANPVARRAEEGREAAPVVGMEVYDPTQEQFRSVVQGVYESLVCKETGTKAFKTATGLRADRKLTQAAVKRLLSKAYAIATTMGQRHGYLEAGTQRPTLKGAALSAARYGADPRFVGKMLAGDTAGQKLASGKDASKREANRQDYEVTLMLARKSQAPRLVLEREGLQLHPRRRNSTPWERRGDRAVLSGVLDLPQSLLPYAEKARKLGAGQGAVLRMLPQTRKSKLPEAIKEAENFNYALSKLLNEASDTLPYDDPEWFTPGGLGTPKLRAALGTLRSFFTRASEDTVRGGKKKNPPVGIAGVGYAGTGGASKGTSRKEFTPTTLYAVTPARDTDRLGYFMISFDPRRKDVPRAISEAKGWRYVDSVSATAFEPVVGEAPSRHTVVAYDQLRAKGGRFGTGYFSIIGPKAKPKDVFAKRGDAENYAKALDRKAVSSFVEQTHDLWKTVHGWEVRGPRAEGRDDLTFADQETAERRARGLDWEEAKSGALPIAGYRTAPGLSGKEAYARFEALIVALKANRVPFVNAVAKEAPVSTVRAHKLPDVLGAEMVRAVNEEDKAATDLMLGAIGLPPSATPEAVRKKLGLRPLATPNRPTKEEIEEVRRAFTKRISTLPERERSKVATKLAALREVGTLEPRGSLVFSKASATAEETRRKKQAPDRLRALFLSRGEDAGKLAAITAEGEKRGEKSLRNLILKVANAEATKKVKAFAANKLGPVKYAALLAEPRAESEGGGRMPGAFNVAGRAFGLPRGASFTSVATDWEHITEGLRAAGIPIPDDVQPEITREMLSEASADDLRFVAEKYGISEVEITKVTTQAERGALAKVLAERRERTPSEMVAAGGFEEVAVPERLRAEMERQRVGKPTWARPRPLRIPSETEEPKPLNVPLADMTREQLKARIAELEKFLGVPKKNGAVSTGVRLAKAGGMLAAKYGKKAYSATMAWAASSEGKKAIARTGTVAASLFGAKAVESGKLSPQQSALLKRELERQTGQTLTSEEVTLSLQLARKQP